MAIVMRVFYQDFVGTHRSHAIVNAITTPGRFALHMIEREWMNHSAGGPRDSSRPGSAGHQLCRLR